MRRLSQGSAFLDSTSILPNARGRIRIYQENKIESR